MKQCPEDTVISPDHPVARGIDGTIIVAAIVLGAMTWWSLGYLLSLLLG